MMMTRHIIATVAGALLFIGTAFCQNTRPSFVLKDGGMIQNREEIVSLLNGRGVDVLFSEDETLPHFFINAPEAMVSAAREKGLAYESITTDASVPVNLNGQILDFAERWVLDGQKIQLDVNEKSYKGPRSRAEKYVGNGELSYESYIYAIKGTDTLKLDIYRDPSVSGKQPVLIYSFPGGWESGSRLGLYSEAFPFARPMVRKGYIVVSIDYRLGYLKARKEGRVADISLTTRIEQGELDTPDVMGSTLDAIRDGVEDLYDATTFIVKNAGKWNADPKKIVLVGGSAGANNSLMAEYWRANKNRLARKHLPRGFKYAAVIPCSGAVWERIGKQIRWKTTPAPIFFFHGTMDTLIPYEEALCPKTGYKLVGPGNLVDGLDKAGASYVLYKNVESDHVMAGLPTGWMNDLMDGLVARYALEGEKAAVRMEERSLEGPHQLLWYLIHCLHIDPAALSAMQENQSAEAQADAVVH